MELISWLGGILLALCGLPLAVEALRTRDTTHYNTWFLAMWTLGEAALLIAFHNHGALALNYGFNLACLTVVWAFHREGNNER